MKSVVFDITKRTTLPKRVAYDGVGFEVFDGDTILTQLGFDLASTNTVSWNGSSHKLKPMYRYEFKDKEDPIGTPLIKGDTYRIYDSLQRWMVGDSLLLIEGGQVFVDWKVIGSGGAIPTNPPLAEGEAFLLNGTRGLSVTIARMANGKIVYEPLMLNSYFVLDGELTFFNGTNFEPAYRPVEARFAMVKNIDLQNLTRAGFEAARDPLDGRVGFTNATCALTAQTNKVENGLYRFTVEGTKITAVRISPFNAGQSIVNSLMLIRIAVGDECAGRLYAFRGVNYKTVGRFVIGTDELEAYILVPSQKDLEKVKSDLLKAIEDGKLSDATKKEITAATEAIKLLQSDKADTTDLTKASDAIAEIKKSLDELPESATPEQITTLEEKIAALSKDLEASAKKIEAAEESADIEALKQKAPIYTLDTTVTVEVGAEVRIDKGGDIQFPTAPPDGTEVRIFDEFGKIKPGKNNIKLGIDDYWLKHDGTYDSTDLVFEKPNQLRNGWMRSKYTSATNSWWPIIAYASESENKQEATVRHTPG